VQLLFGFRSGALAAAADAVARSLGVTFELHDSVWRGGDYYVHEAGSEKIIIQRNNDGGPATEPAEEDFPDYPVLVYVETERPEPVMEQMRKCLPHPEVLRSVRN
jgi:hypothetical protein